MWKSIAALASVAVLSVFATATALAQSSKSGVATSSAILLAPAAETHSWDPVLSTFIRVPQQEDLVLDVALQCGLYTDTLVKTRGRDGPICRNVMGITGGATEEPNHWIA